MDNQNMIDTGKMYAEQQTLYREGVARSDAMVREHYTELREGVARSDAMVRATQEQTRSLMKNPIKKLDEIRFY